MKYHSMNEAYQSMYLDEMRNRAEAAARMAAHRSAMASGKQEESPYSPAYKKAQEDKARQAAVAAAGPKGDKASQMKADEDAWRKNVAAASNHVKEEVEVVMEFLLDEGYVSNEVSAEVFYLNMSEDLLHWILEEANKIVPGPKSLSHEIHKRTRRDTRKAFGLTPKELEQAKKQRERIQKNLSLEKSLGKEGKPAGSSSDYYAKQRPSLERQYNKSVSESEEFDEILEMRKVDKMAGKSPGGSMKDDKAFQKVHKMMRDMSGGRPAGQRKRQKGSPIPQGETPVARMKRNKATAANRPDPYRPRAGESD